MDLATVIGLVAVLGMMGWAMWLSSSGNMAMFYDFVSIVIVFGGSITAVMIKFTFTQLADSMKAAGKAFMFKIESAEELIEKAVQLADAARKGGFLALEEAEIPNPFMQKGINMLVDGHDADVVRATLLKDISLTEKRHETAIALFKSLGDIAPAMGMIGTLIGLVAMLSNMDDPKAIELQQHLTPVYPATEGLTQTRMRLLAAQALEWLDKNPLRELLPQNLSNKSRQDPYCW